MRQEVTHELKMAMQDYLRDIHTVIPGKIVAFDSNKCEARVSPTAKYMKPDGTQIDFPDIFEVPVFFPQAMGQSVTFCHAINEGDECLIFIAEQALDLWRTGAESPTDLRFDISNAIAIVGFFARSNPHVVRACENKSIIIQRAETFIELHDQLIEVETDGDISTNAAKSVTVNAGTTININASSDITVLSASQVIVQAPLISLN